MSHWWRTVGLLTLATFAAAMLASRWWYFPSTVDYRDATRRVIPYLINVNTAAWFELEPLPGIGPVLSQAIVSHREQHGDFVTLDAIRNVHGIGPHRLEQVRPYLDCVPQQHFPPITQR